MSKTGLNRDLIDKFYTKSTVVDDCIKSIRSHITIHKNDIIIEPSAGNGAFIDGIKTLGNNYRFYDICPENEEIEKCDYLDVNLKALKNTYNKIHLVGNPPFGRQSSIAKKFIKKSLEVCHSISFILPKSFKKDSLKRIFPLNFHLVYEMDIGSNSFLVDNVEHDVPCVFQIWIKRDYNRHVEETPEQLYFEFVKREDNPDLSFRRVGVYAGKIDSQIEDKSIQSHYFIKFNDDIDVSNIIEGLMNIQYSKDNTVGPKSISKPEVIKKFNEVIIKTIN
jgi:predicted RNA methylase